MKRQLVPAHLALYAMVFLAAGCMHARIGRPAWMVSRQHQSYPPARYIVGVGEGISLEAAEKEARADLSTVLDQKFAAALSQARKGKHNGPAWFEAGTDPVQSLDSRVAVRWSSSDKSRNAVLVSVDRKQISEKLSGEIGKGEDSCSDLAGQASIALSETRDPSAALLDYLRALDARSSAEGARVLLAAVAAGAPPSPRGPQASDLLDSIGKLLGSIELVAISGDGQRADAQGSLALPLVVGAYLVSGRERFPVVNLPLIFLPPGKKDALGAVTSDVGTCSANFQNLAVVQHDKSFISVVLDTNEVLRRAGLDTADKRYRAIFEHQPIRSAHFAYLSPGQAARRVMILIEESHLGRRVAHSGLGSSLGRKLAERGLLLIDPHAATDDLAQTETLDEAPEATKNHADVLVYGSVTSEITRVISSSFVFCKASGKIKVVELATGKNLMTFEKSIAAAGQDDKSACQRALEKLSAKAVSTLVPPALGAGEEKKP